jgi:hypothetical protein
MAAGVIAALATVKRLAANITKRGCYRSYRLKTATAQKISPLGGKHNPAGSTTWWKKDVPYYQKKLGEGPLHELRVII